MNPGCFDLVVHCLTTAAAPASSLTHVCPFCLAFIIRLTKGQEVQYDMEVDSGLLACRRLHGNMGISNGLQWKEGWRRCR